VAFDDINGFAGSKAIPDLPVTLIQFGRTD
jgi:hypothetical protein